MVAAILEVNICPPAYFAIQYIENRKTSGAYISKNFDLNDIKVAE